MKKIILFLSAVGVLMFSATAAHAQLSVGAGYDYAKFSLRDGEGGKEPSDALNGFYVGADYNVRIWKGLGIAPGVQYEFTNGTVDKESGIKFQEHYLNIPIDINYYFRLGSLFGIGVSLTPSFNIGLASELRQPGAGSIDLYDIWNEIGLGEAGESLGVENPYGRFDFMLGVGLSVDLFRHIRVKARYDFGLVNRVSAIGDLDPDLAGAVKLNRNRLQVGVAYVF